MANKNGYKKTGLKGYIWLLMAVGCIVFSGATRWFIENQVSHNTYASIVPYSKRIKDQKRDKRQTLTAVFHAEKQAGADDLSPVPFVLTTLISFVVAFLSAGSISRVAYSLQPLVPQRRLLYLRDSRLQV